MLPRRPAPNLIAIHCFLVLVFALPASSQTTVDAQLSDFSSPERIQPYSREYRQNLATILADEFRLLLDGIPDLDPIEIQRLERARAAIKSTDDILKKGRLIMEMKQSSIYKRYWARSAVSGMLRSAEGLSAEYSHMEMSSWLVLGSNAMDGDVCHTIHSLWVSREALLSKGEISKSIKSVSDRPEFYLQAIGKVILENIVLPNLMEIEVPGSAEVYKQLQSKNS